MINFKKIINSTEFKIFITLFFTYLVFTKYDGWNENSRLDLVLSIVNDKSLSIDNYHYNTGDKSYFQGHFYSDKAPGSSLLVVPIYYIYSKTFGKVNCNKPDIFNCEDYKLFLGLIFVIILFSSSLCTALTGVILYKFLNYFSKKEIHKIIIVYLFGLSTIAFQYATIYLGHATSMFFMFAAYYLVFRYFKENKGNLFFPGTLAMFSFLVDFTNFGFILVLALFIFIKKSSLKQVIYFGAGLFLVSLILLSYNSFIYKNPFDISYRHLYLRDSIAKKELKEFNLLFVFSEDIHNHFDPNIELYSFFISKPFRVFFYPYRGLFFYSPVLLFGFYFLIRTLKKDLLAKLVFLNVLLMFFFHFISINYWWGGSAFSSRYLLTLVPFLCIYIIKIFNVRLKFIYFLFILTLFLSFLFMLSGHQKWEQIILNMNEDSNFDAWFFDHHSKYSYNYKYFLPLENPLFSYYLPLLLKHGPKSLLIEEMSNIQIFPWINFLSCVLLFFIMWYHKKQTR